MNTLETALTWRELGVATIPICAHSKVPALDHWGPYQERLPRTGELEAWFSSGRYGIAVITGWQGLVVVDFDDLHAYTSWLSSLDGASMKALSTYHVRTRRGWHLYFYSDEQTTTTPGHGCDVKASGGYVLSPPSQHPSGHVYQAVGHPNQISRVKNLNELHLEAYIDQRAKRATDELPRRRYIGTDPYTAALNGGAPDIAAIKARHSIYELLGIPRASRRVSIRCPLPGHQDDMPSFVIYPDGHFYCFGCGQHGDVLTLYTLLHNVSLSEALRKLA